MSFLLLDCEKEPFHPSERTLETVDALVSRAAKSLSSVLSQSSAPDWPQTSPLLTAREKQVTQLLAEGYTTKEIAAHLYLSHHTITEHIRTILSKLKAKNRPEAIAKAFRQHLIH
ncbi:hypothetical protein CHM34_08385 [Paludifilum halophilum]|uniref:HTH luxR-type domain-containing protein n=2 Tax=Paludifilum halophilum TaxID=1642702 RepID=A0A235B8D0_9BACL|nr:LuxR C-terminal-related transcriptional regulator [Paludifilum halophilum]OYD08117.1 hypothetical protein CHM34_08385 [Paludifilum halophilum]